jgi:hypothetical protein
LLLFLEKEEYQMKLLVSFGPQTSGKKKKVPGAPGVMSRLEVFPAHFFLAHGEHWMYEIFFSAPLNIDQLLFG